MIEGGERKKSKDRREGNERDFKESYLGYVHIAILRMHTQDIIMSWLD